MRYTLGAASKATGKSKTTIQRAISKGLISAVKLENGGYSIDPSELHRVFPMLHGKIVSETAAVDTATPQDEPPVLKARIQALEEMLTREREALEEVRTDRDAWKQQATALLVAPSKQKKSWWPF